jgi:hypothetical protein
MSSKIKAEMEKNRRELEQAVNETIEETIRSAGPINSLAWVGVVAGSFLINLLLLVVVAGG